MKKFACAISCLLLLVTTVCSQPFLPPQNNIWYFGDFAGINFNSGAAVTINSGQIATAEGCATVCGEGGDLLFYTDGMRVWNKNHFTMLNGVNLNGDWSSTQSALIVRKPESTGTYYIFTAAGFANDGLSYTIVDMALENGLGDVTMPNQELINTVSERVTAIKHANGNDIWIVAHEYWTDNYHSFLLTAAGLSSTSVVSQLGPVLDSTDDFVGMLKPSPDGNRLASTFFGNANFMIMNFDRSTGAMSSYLEFPNAFQGCYGAEFSFNGSLIYITQMSPESYIWQFNLDAGSETDILNSGIIISTDTAQYHFGDLKKAPDGKIYVSRNLKHKLSVINQPDSVGLNCMYEDSAFHLGTGTCHWGLPNVLVFSDSLPSAIIPFIEVRESSVFPNPATDQITFSLPTNLNISTQIFNTLGQQCSPIRSLTSANGTSQMDVSSLPAGFYSILIIAEDKRYVAKFVKE
jgi:hypothetical protein